jgi:uncharacterized protein with von Willebrand factor type A (vWA) domain
MSKKSSESGQESKQENSHLSEMEQLRQLVFGGAKHALETQITQVHTDLSQAIEALREFQLKQYEELNESMTAKFAEMENKLDSIDAHHEDNHSAQVKASESLQSQLEMAESAGKDDADALNDRISKEIAQINRVFEDKYAEAMKKLEQVTHELTDSKTDRKTLARLLATMATNLETD